MFRFKVWVPTIVILSTLQLPLAIHAEDAPAAPVAPSQGISQIPPTDRLAPGVCPANPGAPLPTHRSEIKSDPILIPAPIPQIVVPPNTDKVTTPSPTPGKKPVATGVPDVQQANVPIDATKPITLNQALEIAFRNNPEIQIAIDQVEASRGVINEANARFNPVFNASATGTLQGPTSTIAFPGGGAPVTLVPGTTGAAGVNFLLPLDISRRLAYNSDIAFYQFQIQYLSMVATSQRLISSVKSAYYDLLRACGQRDVAQAAVDVARTIYTNTEAKQRAGTVALFDLTTAQVNLANVSQTLLEAQNNVYLAQTSFNRILGIDVNNPTQVIGSTEPVTICSVDIPKETDIAYARRPEVKSSQTAITLNKRNIKLQETGYLPSLALSAGVNDGFTQTGLNPNQFTWQTSINLSVPIWDGGVTRARVRQARANEQSSVDTLTQTKLTVAQDVRSAALNLVTAAKRIQTTAEALTLAREALRLANVRYEAGIAVLVEVTNAQQQLTLAGFNYINAQYDYAVALAQLQRATSTQPELDHLQMLTSPTAATRDNSQEVRK